VLIAYPSGSSPSRHKKPVETAGLICPPECLQVRIKAANKEAATKKSDPFEELIP